MDSFVFQNPTKLIFGKDQLDRLGKEVTLFGKKILFVFGGGSIKRNGLYDQIIQRLRMVNCDIEELAGVEPNPRLSTVHKGIDICKNKNIEFILAVGGGSVIDAAKAIAVGAKYDGEVWDIITRKERPTEALPIGTVLTLAATGSEMNANSVITHWEKDLKVGWSSPLVFPKFSILNRTHTKTVPKDQTVYGIVDMMSHVLEAYFHPATNTPLQDRICESILATVIETAPQLLENLESYEHRETILYCGTMALNGITQMGARGDWATHNIEHAVSAVYDIPHAGGLAILFPHWLKHTVDVNVSRHVQLAKRVFGVNSEGKTDQEVAIEGIERLSQFWKSLGASSKLSDYRIEETSLDKIADIASINGEFGNYKKLSKKDVMEILIAAK